MTRRMLRALAVTLLAGTALLLGSAPAFAHARLESSDPADGASMDTGPQRVTLIFSDTMSAEFTALTVIGPDQGAYQTGPVTADGDTVSTAVLPLGPAGRYEIGYRVVSEDGHPVTGSLSFTLTAPGPGGAAPAATSAGATPAEEAVPVAEPTAPAGSDPGGAPVWPWIVGAVVLVGGGVVVAMRLGRG